MTLRLGRFAIEFGGLQGEKHVQFLITFHWGYNEPKASQD